MLELLKAPFLVLHFSYHKLMTFLMMLSVILLSTFMILLSILSVIRHLTCGNNLNCPLNLNLIQETLWIGTKSALLISRLEKLNWFWFDRFNNNGSIDVKMDGSVFEKRSSFKMLGLTFSSKFDWGSYIISIAKTVSQKIGALIPSMKFVFPEVAFYLYKSTIRPQILLSCLGWCPQLLLGIVRQA